MDETEVVVSERSPGLDGPLLVLTDILPVEDHRQGFLRSVLGEVVRDGEGSQVATIDTTGFPASCVNLGWLQDKIRAYWVENVPFEEGSPGGQSGEVDQLPGQGRLRCAFDRPGVCHEGRPRLVHLQVQRPCSGSSQGEGWAQAPHSEVPG